MSKCWLNSLFCFVCFVIVMLYSYLCRREFSLKLSVTELNTTHYAYMKISVRNWGSAH